ncbi:hypothetical protein M569_05617, partial [Genlisea aurea]
DMFTIDEAYEFSAPRFFDFVGGETEYDAKRAENWFEKTAPYAPSPFMLRIKATRAVQPHILCNFGEEDQRVNDTVLESNIRMIFCIFFFFRTQAEVIPEEAAAIEEKIDHETTSSELNVRENDTKEVLPCFFFFFASFRLILSSMMAVKIRRRMLKLAKYLGVKKDPRKIRSIPETAKNQMQKSQAKSSIKPGSLKKKNNTAGTPSFAQENHAIKRQKLDEGGKSRQIRTLGKPANLTHKTRTAGGQTISNSNSTVSNANKTCKEERKMYFTRGQQPVVPFISTAEMLRKFQSGTRELSLSRNSSASQGKPKLLTLTRPKTPEFETSQRVRTIKIKSSAELEEEMMANIPKFKARPVNKKIMQAPTLPPLPRATPHPPEFKEFHLETMSRANQNSETSTVASIETTESHQWRPQLTAPKSPLLQTSLRARPPKSKSFEESMNEELQKVPQFKARPLNRKILESKGDMGIFSHMKKHLTIPQEFNFSVDKRIPPPTIVLDQFDKLSINSESHQDKKSLPKNTVPNPFHLHTEERGLEKEKKLAEELTQKQLEEERARIPKAHPYPYTTDYPVVPPKPDPKPITRPEPFQLECLVRHEEEMQREMEEKRRMEMEEAQMRLFKAQPILKEDPIPVPAKTRKPLTEVQEFDLHVDNRAVDRAEFDKKIKEKERIYKRYREEAESARMMEEEKALKQLRRTLVPQARPVPNFDRVFIPQKSCKQTTKAKSPKLLVDRRNENRTAACP